MRKGFYSSKIDPDKYNLRNSKYNFGPPEWKEDDERDPWFDNFYIMACTGFIGYILYMIFLVVRGTRKTIGKRKNKSDTKETESEAKEK